MDGLRIARASLLFVICGLSASGALSQPADGAHPEALAHIRFYDKDWAGGHNFCSVVIDKAPWVSTGNFFGCTRDEARSAKLENLPPGTRIVLYDDPACGDSDDYAIITITKLMSSIIVPGFKTEVTYSDWQMRVHYDNGLMGKVSCAEVDVPGAASTPHEKRDRAFHGKVTLLKGKPGQRVDHHEVDFTIAGFVADLRAPTTFRKNAPRPPDTTRIVK